MYPVPITYPYDIVPTLRFHICANFQLCQVAIDNSHLSVDIRSKT